MKRLRVSRCLAIGLVLVAGCTQSITIGPFPVSLPVEGGSIDPSLFILLPGLALDYSTEQEFCALPTEQDIVDQMPTIASMDISSLVRLKSIELADIVLTATSGDFSFLREITLSFVPKPIDGEEQEPVVIGYAYSASGFGSTVTLTPPDDVDLLELIRANDDNPSEDCPTLKIDITGTRPSQTVNWEGQVDADVYATVGR